jgi:SAM-dependent methyltransferase
MPMNENHARVCPSPEWAQFLQADVLPWVAQQTELGAELLEVGPGPGAATDWLRHRVARLVAVESDADAAQALQSRFAGENVEVHSGDARQLPFPDGSFDSAASFTMLHHVPTVGDQNRLLAEVLRVLRPGGVLIGSDSLPSNDLHHFHESDVYNPIEPGTLFTRLETIGYTRITLRVHDSTCFVAHKPDPAADSADGGGKRW